MFMVSQQFQVVPFFVGNRRVLATFIIIVVWGIKNDL